MTEPLFPQLDANLVESIREFSRWRKGGELIERDGALLIAGSALYAQALRLDERIAAGAMLDTMSEFFQQGGRRFTLWTRPAIDDDMEKAAMAAGFREVSSSPWMVLDAPIQEEKAPTGLKIREVRDEAGILDARDVNREAYASLQLPPSEIDAIYSLPHRILNASCMTFVGYEEGEPVTTAMLLLTRDIGGVYWVGTVAAARGKGYAAAMTRAVSNAGFESGARVVTLQASVMGESIYKRLGYRTIGQQKWLLSPRPEKL